MTPPPELRGGLFGGVGRRLRHDPLGTLQAASRLGDVVLLRAGLERYYLLRSPDHIKHVLQDHHRNYRKQTAPYLRSRALFGDGLLTLEGEPWRLRRRLVQPGLQRQALEGYTAIMERAASELGSRLQARVDSGGLVDMAAELTSTTFSVLSRTLLGSEPPGLASKVGEWSALVGQHLSAAVVLPRWIPTTANRRMRRVVGELDELVQGLVCAARAAAEPRGDLLTRLIHGREAQTHEGLTDRQLRDEVMTMFFAGSETTAAALTWTFYLLAAHPEAQARLRAELDARVGSRAPKAADVEHLDYARMVLEEAMRLYPPAWSISRRAAEDDSIGGHRIPAGGVALVSPWITHRLPELWDNPDEFVPERFAPGRAESLPRFAYFPFLGGPRQCVGAQYSNLEASILLATLIQRFRFKLFPLLPVHPEPWVTLRPRGGLRLIVKNA